MARGNIYFSREIYDAYFSGASAVALVEREHRLFVVPLIIPSSGGLLLKVRNTRGDRVLHAQEFFRGHGYGEDFEKRVYPVELNVELAALEIIGIPRLTV